MLDWFSLIGLIRGKGTVAKWVPVRFICEQGHFLSPRSHSYLQVYKKRCKKFSRTTKLLFAWSIWKMVWVYIMSKHARSPTSSVIDAGVLIGARTQDCANAATTEGFQCHQLSIIRCHQHQRPSPEDWRWTFEMLIHELVLKDWHLSLLQPETDLCLWTWPD